MLGHCQCVFSEALSCLINKNGPSIRQLFLNFWICVSSALHKVLVLTTAPTLTSRGPDAVHFGELAPGGPSDGTIGGLMAPCMNLGDMAGSEVAHQSEFYEHHWEKEEN